MSTDKPLAVPPGDRIDDLLAIGGSFDWITPLVNWLQRYNYAAVVGVSLEEAVVEQMRLKKEGTKSRIEGNFSSYRVVRKGRQ